MMTATELRDRLTFMIDNEPETAHQLIAFQHPAANAAGYQIKAVFYDRLPDFPQFITMLGEQAK